MARLPQIGGDQGNWGTVLNEFLLVGHHEDGTTKDTITVVNVKDFGAKGDGVADDTAAINAALAAADTGSIVYFPEPASYYRITNALEVRKHGLLIRGASRSTEIRQETWTKPVFDLLDVNDVTVELLTLSYSGSNRTMPSNSVRGSNAYTFSAGVWANGQRITVRDIFVKRFVVGVFFSAWEASANGHTNKQRYGNKMINVECEQVDFGILYLSQTNLLIDQLYTHDHLDASGGKNPTHAVYGSSSPALPSYNLVLSNSICTNNPYGHAYVIKGQYGGTLSNLISDNSQGLFTAVDLADVSMSNMVGRNNLANIDSAFSLQQTSTQKNKRNTVSNIMLHLKTFGRTASLMGDDSVYEGITVHCDYSGTGSPNTYDMIIRGSRNTLANIRINNSGTGKTLGMIIGLSGYTTSKILARGIICTNTSNTVTVHSSATNVTVLDKFTL